MNDMFEYCVIDSHKQLEKLLVKSNLCKVYYNCFHIEIYHFEDPDSDEICNTLTEYYLTGVLIVCINGENDIVGFAAAQPLSSAEKCVQTLAKEHCFDLDSDWYHAELGVADQYKRKGIGRNLVNMLLKLIPANRILMRTQENNIPSITLHRSLGFEIVEGMSYFHSSPDDRRIFLSLVRN